MPDVARVIYNRLAAGTPLQMNSTVLYSLGQDGGPVTAKDLALQTPYNTYLNTRAHADADLHARPRRRSPRRCTRRPGRGSTSCW